MKKVKKGPKVGFLNDKVNAEVIKILTESNIQCKIENEEILIENKEEIESNSDSCTEFYKINSNNVDLGYNSDFNFEIDSDDNFDINIDDKLDKKKNNNINLPRINVEFVKKRMNSGFEDTVVNDISTLYLKYLKNKEINHEFLNNLHDIFSPNNIYFRNSFNQLRTVVFQDYKSLDNIMIEYIPGSKTDSLHINFNLIVDFFKYGYNIALIIYPSVILLRIRQKSLSPGLLFAIYAGAYLFRPNQDKIKSRFYYFMAFKSLLRNIRKNDIQNLQTAFILSNILPGVYINYMLSGITLRLVKVLNLNDDSKQNKNNLFYYERVNSIWLSINIDTLLNLTCNCLDHLNWLDQPIPQSITDRMLMEKYPPTKGSIKYIVIINYIAKVIKHAKDRREGKFNNKEFKKLMEELETIRIHLKEYFNNFQEKKNKLKYRSIGCQFYIYLIYFTAKLILFNMELSPFVYQNKLFSSKKYIKIRKSSRKVQSHLNNSSNNTNNNMNKDYFDISINENSNNSKNINETESTNFTSQNFNDDYFKNRYHFFSILENIPNNCFNYKTYVETYEMDNNDDTLFLNIPPLINDMDYESCYYICFETVELAKNVLYEINENINQSRIIYPCYLCFAFYNIGLFYMLIYANFKNEQVKMDIEYFHDQIKNVYEYYPYISVYFSKMYERAKMDAYEAFLDDSIIFCPKGSF
ncbi:hypothetical protein U3516DRAFT_626361 [Neocallimastix sp. 'constans']